jgi:hypothetical protein
MTQSQIAEPQIKDHLESAELTTNLTDAVRQRLSACLASDPSHITPGQKGEHVKAIQDALEKIRQKFPDLGLLPITDPAGEYGKSTADAVLKYKGINAIQRSGQPLDNIVGRMTITQMDDDLRILTKPQELPVQYYAPVEISTVDDDLNKSDLSHRPAPSNSLSGSQLTKTIYMRQKTTFELEQMMLDDLSNYGHPEFGPKLARAFFANTSTPDGVSAFGADSDFSNFVARTNAWKTARDNYRRLLDQKIKQFGKNGPFGPLILKGFLRPPIPSFGVGATGLIWHRAVGSNDPDAAMKALVGSFQGAHVFLNDFEMDPTTRKYSGTLFYQLIDHFGIDDSDLDVDTHGHGSDSQVAFWVLQRERHNPGHMPYRLKVVIKDDLQGTF